MAGATSADDVASTGPRFMKRGNNCSSYDQPNHKSCFNGAALHEARKSDNCSICWTSDPTQRLNELTGEALARGERLEGLEVRRPTLEEIYLELTRE